MTGKEGKPEYLPFEDPKGKRVFDRFGVFLVGRIG